MVKEASGEVMFGLTLNNNKPILGGSGRRVPGGGSSLTKAVGVESWACMRSREEATLAGPGP